MSDAFAIIMAGGSGTRFWPLSRRDRPKQLLPLGAHDEALLAATVRRTRALIPPSRIYIVTNERLAEPIAKMLPDIPRENVLAEPIGRNTAPCVAWAAAHVRRKQSEGVIAVLPADHHITDEQAFVDTLSRALDAATHGDMVTVGIQPTRPETGYGYIEVGEELGSGIHRARRFVEKPNQKRAEQFLAAGSFLWNSGMFFFRADVILDAVEAHLPGLGDAVRAFDDASARGDERAEVARLYADLPSVSIDHGVMEKAERVAVLPASFGWSDLGSWTTAWELAERDGDDNALPEGAIAIDSRGCYVRAPEGKVVALVGVRDLVVVDTEDAILIVPRDRAQDVRAVVDALKSRGDERL